MDRNTMTEMPAHIASAPPVNRMRYVLLLGLGLGAIALFLLATASANSQWFSERYRLLLWLNGAVATLLALLVGYQLYALLRKLRARQFGAKLTLRLVALLAMMSVVPGVILYGVSVQFLGRSIDSWFQVRVDKALEGGLNVSRGALDALLQDVKGQAESMALQLSLKPAAEHGILLNQLRERARVQEAALFTTRGKVIAYVGNENAGIVPEAPAPEALRQMRTQRSYAAVDALPDRGLVLRALVPVPILSVAQEPRILQLLQPVPRSLAQDAETIQNGYREYQELVLSRVGLKRLYGITLTLTMLLALLSALAAAFYLSEEFSAPLSALVEGTRAIAQGDYTRRARVASRDELGVLMQSFNSMTNQLDDARSLAQRQQAEVAQSKAYLEGVLSHLSAGVLVFDGALNLRSANPSASNLLGNNCAPLLGAALNEWPAHVSELADVGGEIRTAFEGSGGESWERQVTRRLPAGDQLLMLRGTPLPVGVESGYVVVFDDVTHVLQAQRDAAWAEVARRLAHEIKNPLTPIQLSAERVQLKLGSKLAPADAEMLSRSTGTIVKQVTALKRMVDAFSQYARAPEPSMRELDLNALVKEVLTMYESLDSRIRLELAAGLPPIVGDAAQLRQVIHNLMQNAQDALGDAEQSAIVVASVPVGNAVQLSVTDNGTGFPENLMKRAFEPYVTTKPKGTGLGLVIVKKIIEEHGGDVAIANVAPHGARVLITLPAAQQQKSAA
jgi:nitrogen fixation/metabolism regulation signal transduction histidine kinase